MPWRWRIRAGRCELEKLFYSNELSATLKNMVSSAFLAALALVASSPAYAWWRIACTTPIVSGMSSSHFVCEFQDFLTVVNQFRAYRSRHLAQYHPVESRSCLFSCPLNDDDTVC